MAVDPYVEFDDPYTEFDTPSPKPSPAPKKPAAPKKAAAPAAPKELTWGQALSGGYGNLRKGAEEFAGAFKTAIAEPTNAAYKAATGTMDTAEALKNLDADKAWAAMQAVGGEYAKRYGSLAGFKQAINDHPYQVINDMVTIATLPIGGGVAAVGKTAAKVGAKVAPGATAAAVKAGNTIGRAASSIPGKVAGKAAKAVVAPTQTVNDLAAFAGKTAIPYAARTASNALNPTSELLTRVAEGRGRQVVNSIRNAREIVPGSVPTTRQAAAAAGAPGFQAVVRAAEKARPAADNASKTAQHAARVQQLRSTINVPEGVSVGQHADDLRKIREANRAQGYGDAYPRVAPVQVDDPVMEILNRPLNSGVIGDAQEIANSDAAGMSQFIRPRPAQEVPDPFGQNIAPEVIPARPGMMNGAFVDDLKKAFDDIAYKGKSNLTGGGLSPRQVEVLRNNREDFLSWVDQHIPQYTAARKKYQSDSHEIDRAMVIKYLEEKLQSPTLGEDTITPRADVFSNAIREAPGASSTVKASTGDKYFNNLDDRFNPDQMGKITSVQDDMARAKLADEQAVTGAPEYGNSLNRMMSEALGFSPNNQAASALLGFANRRLADRTTNALSDPATAAKLMEIALARQGDIDAIRKLYGYGLSANQFNPIRVMNRYPALYNPLMMGQQEDQSNALAR